MDWKPLKSTRGRNRREFGRTPSETNCCGLLPENTLSILPAAIPNNERDRMQLLAVAKKWDAFIIGGGDSPRSVGQADKWERLFQEVLLLSLDKFSKYRARGVKKRRLSTLKFLLNSPWEKISKKEKFAGNVTMEQWVLIMQHQLVLCEVWIIQMSYKPTPIICIYLLFGIVKFVEMRTMIFTTLTHASLVPESKNLIIFLIKTYSLSIHICILFEYERQDHCWLSGRESLINCNTTKEAKMDVVGRGQQQPWHRSTSLRKLALRWRSNWSRLEPNDWQVRKKVLKKKIIE